MEDASPSLYVETQCTRADSSATRRCRVDCGPDTIQPLVDGEAVVVEAGIYSLGDAARKILQCCIVANRRWSGKDMLVDYPEVFVVMPFQEGWSSSVLEKMIKPAIEGSNLRCVRGDTPPRVGDLT